MSDKVSRISACAERPKKLYGFGLREVQRQVKKASCEQRQQDSSDRIRVGLAAEEEQDHDRENSGDDYCSKQRVGSTAMPLEECRRPGVFANPIDIRCATG